MHTKSRVAGATSAKDPLPDNSGEASISGDGASSLWASGVDKAGAEAVDFGVPGTETDLWEAELEFDRCSPPPASLFNIFLISIHSLRPVQASSPPPNTQHQSLFAKKSGKGTVGVRLNDRRGLY